MLLTLRQKQVRKHRSYQQNNECVFSTRREPPPGTGHVVAGLWWETVAHRCPAAAKTRSPRRVVVYDVYYRLLEDRVRSYQQSVAVTSQQSSDRHGGTGICHSELGEDIRRHQGQTRRKGLPETEKIRCYNGLEQMQDIGNHCTKFELYASIHS